MIGKAPEKFGPPVDIYTVAYDEPEGKKIVAWAIKRFRYGFATVTWKVVDNSPQS